jgi:hypothetical protein
MKTLFTYKNIRIMSSVILLLAYLNHIFQYLCLLSGVRLFNTCLKTF